MGPFASQEQWGSTSYQHTEGGPNTFWSQSHWASTSQQNAEAGPSRSSEDRFITEAQGRYENNGRDSDQDDESDGTYIESEEESDYETSMADETGDDDAEEEPQQRQQAEKLITSYQGQHVYSDIGDFNAASIDRDEFALKMWKRKKENIGLRTCFNDKEEIRAAMADWSSWQNRQHYVKYSDPKSWVAECITRKTETPPGQSTCGWRMRASRKAHGLFEIALRCDTLIGDQYWEKFCEYENTAAGHDVEVYDEPNLVYKVNRFASWWGPGRTQKPRYMMAMDYRGRRRRCRRCSAADHKTRECPRSHCRADRTRINVNWDADGFEGVEELWAWERIPMIRPQRQCDEEFFKDHAFGARWCVPLGLSGVPAHTITAYRDQFSALTTPNHEFSDSISALAENALSIVPTEMPTLYPSQVVLQIQPKRPITVAKHRRANIPKARIGGRKKVVESNEFFANLFQTPSPQEQTMFTGEQTMFTMEQEQTTTKQGIEIEVTPTIEQDAEFQASQTLQQSSLPLAKRKQDRKHRPPKKYTPSRSTPPSPEE
ncbi:OLC1v1008644C1 [Oldenlandia corymbosa var. corymbosa]|uniref:OLC1v1008644C1 n=1 Tax=Oldenlandia corymbosa var. corymbosa TaxID=529605 RepID=A0AAV1DMM9_OLDCO|nr:OLC1v1008644C1 [Oldenlandia corymbosa var. corymbosa]